MSEITYDDKIDLNVESTIANINKVTASDMNEIKSVVNENAETLDEINVPSNWVEVGTTAPTDKKVWFKANKNIFDLTTAYHGTINGSGVVGPNESFRTTQYIPTNPATKYYFSTTQISGQTNKQIYIAYYDSSYNFLSRDSYNLLEQVFTTPTNCYYMRAGVYYACQENIMLELGNTKSTYVPFGNQDLIVNGGKFIADQLVSVGETNSNDGRRIWFSKSDNLVQSSNINMQNGLSDTGELVANTPSRVAIYKVPVSPNQKYNLSCGTNYLIGNVFEYNKSGTYTGTNGSDYANAKEYISTATTYYISFVLRNSSNTTIQPSEINNIQPSGIMQQGIYVDNEQIYNKTAFDQNTSLITEYGNRMVLWGCEELGLKYTGYNADNCLPGQAFSWSVGQTITNVPSGVAGGRIYCFKGYGNAGKFQLCFDYPNNVSRIYFRNYFGSWGGWKYITLTAL